jgi:hypothetical protein
MSYAFIGPYFLSPYYARFEEAVNLAASKFSDPDNDDDSAIVPPLGSPSPAPTYTLLQKRNVGMTALLIFARDPDAALNIEVAEVGFGAAEMGNKGAVAMRVLYQVPEGDQTELTFVATHLAAMEWNLPRRNANWATIMRGLTFDDPEAILNPKNRLLTAANGEGSAEDEAARPGGAEEAVRLLHDQHYEESFRLQEKLQNISIFKPSSHLFVSGDLNYRIATYSPHPLADFPSLDPESEHYFPRYLPLDQLTRERDAGRTLHGLSEASINFPPTYKYVILPVDNPTPGNTLAVPWTWARHRFPGWTDRILYMDVAPWVKIRNQEAVPEVSIQAYDAMPVLATSDHRPVFLRADVPVLDPQAMVPPPRTLGGDREGAPLWKPEWDSDPRVTLPIAIDPEAWGRREAGRRKEVVTGWSMFLWSTREGAIILATMMVVGFGTWWLWSQK